MLIFAAQVLIVPDMCQLNVQSLLGLGKFGDTPVLARIGVVPWHYKSLQG